MNLSTRVSLRLSHTVRSVDSAWFRSNVEPAYGGTWDEIEARMTSDPLESRRLAELESEIAREGIQRPVNVFYENWWSLRPCVADGMHRALAAMKLQVSIPVARDYVHPETHPMTDVYRVSVEGMAIDEMMLAVLSVASFRSESGAWIQADSASGTDDGAIEMYLPCHPDYRQTIAAELTRRMHAAGLIGDAVFVENRVN